MANITHIAKRKIELQQNINLYRNNMRRLLDFATGYKKPAKVNKKMIRVKNNDSRLLDTIKNLLLQARRFQYEFDKLSHNPKNSIRKT